MTPNHYRIVSKTISLIIGSKEYNAYAKRKRQEKLDSLNKEIAAFNRIEESQARTRTRDNFYHKRRRDKLKALRGTRAENCQEFTVAA